jgi:hypothetical protein
MPWLLHCPAGITLRILEIQSYLHLLHKLPLVVQAAADSRVVHSVKTMCMP